jgi:CheY-like chemotaxis protein
MVSNNDESSAVTAGGALPAEFRETVRELLEHLFDLPFLQQHPLARHPALQPVNGDETPTQSFRKFLLSVVEALQPTGGQAPGSQQTRAYSIVYLHYIDGMTVHEASHQLGISLRQAYRDLQRGVDSVASLMWERLQSTSATPDDDTPLDEVQRLLPRPETVDLLQLCANAVRAIGPLAAQKAVMLHYAPQPEAVRVSTDRTVAQQILVHVLSGIIQHGQPAHLSISVEPGKQEAASVVMTCQDLSFRLDAGIRSDVTQQLAARLGWVMSLDDNVVRLRLPPASRMLLVIDDNAALADLLDRYLDGTDYHVVAATDPLDGLRMCQTLQPQAVLLDVMMPNIDGWELLQRIRNNPATAEIPVIVCTVFNDAELAYSLGANYFLPKPVVRDDFRDILQTIKARR